MSGSVYVIRPIGHPGPVKIGHSQCPPNRVQQLMEWSPFPLEIVASFPGDRALEAQLHSRFAHSYSHREWFHPTSDILEFVSKIERGSSLDEAVDLSQIQGSIRFNVGPKASSRKYRSWRMKYVHALKRLANYDKWPYGKARDHIDTVMERWRGNIFSDVAVRGAKPNEQEFVELTDFISNPSAYIAKCSLRSAA